MRQLTRGDTAVKKGDGALEKRDKQDCISSSVETR